MDLRKLIHILFSKSLLLSYLFVGYLAITEKSIPLGALDSSVQMCSDDFTNPSAYNLDIIAPEHVRPAIEYIQSVHLFSDDLILSRSENEICAILLCIPPRLHEETRRSANKGRAPPRL